MAGKTPISALQELMQALKIHPPVYTEGGFSPNFTCKVEAAGVSAIGSGSNKKAAKHDCAQKALQKLSSSMKTPQNPQIIIVGSSPSLPFRNYVGELNEFASKRYLKAPEYDFISVSTGGEFFIKCSFLNKEIFGKGTTKKDAKQDSARRMLDLVMSLDPAEVTRQTNQHNPRADFDAENNKKVISIFEKLSMNSNDKAYVMKTDEIKAVPQINISAQDTLETLELKLRQAGIKYTLEMIQKNPFMMCVRIIGTDLCFIGHGITKEEATRDVLMDVLETAQSGCCLSTNDLISL